MPPECNCLRAAEPRQLCKTICLCFYYPLLRSRWQLCCLTDAAHPFAGAALLILRKCSLTAVYR